MTRDLDSSPTQVTFLVTRTQIQVTMYNDSNSDSDSTLWTKCPIFTISKH